MGAEKGLDRGSVSSRYRLIKGLDRELDRGIDIGAREEKDMESIWVK